MELSFGLWLCIIHIFALISELTAETYDGNGKGLTTFPTDIPANSTDIDLYGNNINSFPGDAFNDFDQLEKLDIGHNPFTVMPDLSPVGGTLKFLWMSNCKLTELNASIVNELVVLEEIDLDYCPLTSFPNLPGPGNTLRTIYCYRCSVSTFPMLSQYKSLEYIRFADNPMTSVPECHPLYPLGPAAAYVRRHCISQIAAAAADTQHSFLVKNSDLLRVAAK